MTRGPEPQPAGALGHRRQEHGRRGGEAMRRAVMLGHVIGPEAGPVTGLGEVEAMPVLLADIVSRVVEMIEHAEPDHPKLKIALPEHFFGFLMSWLDRPQDREPRYRGRPLPSILRQCRRGPAFWSQTRYFGMGLKAEPNRAVNAYGLWCLTAASAPALPECAIRSHPVGAPTADISKPRRIHLIFEPTWTAMALRSGHRTSATETGHPPGKCTQPAPYLKHD